MHLILSVCSKYAVFHLCVSTQENRDSIETPAVSPAIGYDPAVDAFATRPEGRFDVVTCLDVIDIVEPRFLPALLHDVAAFTAGLAVFDVLTKPNRLRPHPPFHWTSLVRQHMDVVESSVEFAGMQDFERVVIIAAPRRNT